MTVETMEIGSNEEFKSAMKRYRRTLDEILKRIQQLIDQKQLGLTKDVMEIVQRSATVISSKKEVKKLITQICIEWKNLNDDQKDVDVPEFEDKGCSDGDHCRSWKRMLFIGKLFKDHFAKPLIKANAKNAPKIKNVLYLDIFQQCLSDYSAVSLLNDVHHLKSLHGDGGNAIQCECYQSDGKCPGEMMRKYRERERGDDTEDSKMEQETTPFQQYMNGLDETERLIMDISTKMHDALCHRHDEVDEVADTDEDGTEYKVRSLKWWKTRTPINNQANKFINEVTVKDDEKEGGRMDELDDLLSNLTPGFHAHVIIECVANRSNELSIKSGEVLRIIKEPDANGWTLVRLGDVEAYVPMNNIRSEFYMDSHRLMTFLAKNGFDSEAVLDDLMNDENEPINTNDSNLFSVLNGNQFLMKTIRRHLDGNDDDDLPVFSFGTTQWKYWPHFMKTRPDECNEEKYSNLKEESTTNKIHSVSTKRFNQIVAKAVVLKQSNTGRTMRAVDMGDANNRYQIPASLPISVAHIVVLLMYCNHTDLQYKYKKFGCRKRSDEQTKEDFKSMNSEIGHFYRLLTEVVNVFGCFANSNNVFYTGLNVKLSFSNFSPEFLCPFSTTVDLDVAHRFSNGVGIILKLVPAPGSTDRYFDVEWLSDFDFERERLFICAFDLVIDDIRYLYRGKFPNNSRYLRAFALFSELFEGHFIRHLLRKRKGQRKAEMVLLDLISGFKKMNNIPNDSQDGNRRVVPLYIQQLFSKQMRQFREEPYRRKRIIRSEFDRLSVELKSELFDIESSGISSGQQRIEKYPFFRSLYDGTTINVTGEYIWVIDGAQILQLQDNPDAAGRLYSDECKYEIPGSGNLTLEFNVWRQSSARGMNRADIGIKVKDSTVGMVSGNWSIFVDEIDWFYNGCGLHRMESGSRFGLIAFDSNLLDNIESLTVHFAFELWKA